MSIGAVGNVGFSELSLAAGKSFIGTFFHSVCQFQSPMGAAAKGAAAILATVIDASVRPILQKIPSIWIGAREFWALKLIVVLAVTKIAIVAAARFFKQAPLKFSILQYAGVAIASRIFSAYWKERMETLEGQGGVFEFLRWTAQFYPNDPSKEITLPYTVYWL